MPKIIEHVTGVRIGVNVWMYPLCEFIGGVIGLGLTIPIETVRRRLQAQVIVHGLPDVNPESEKYSTAKSSPIVGSPKLEDGRVPSCVHLSPRPYTGIFDCIWRILTEERSGPPPHHHHSKRRTGSRPMMRSPRASSTSTTPKPRQGKNKNVSRLSGGGSSGSKRDVRNVFDAEAAAVGAGGGTSSSGGGGHHRPRMLSEEMRESERRVLNYRPSPQSNLGPSSSGVSGAAQESTQFAGKVEQEFERAKEEIEREGLEGWLEGTGVGQLYRGFGMGVGALALVLVLGLITGEESEGWAEL
ncbi:hypothetical protein FRB91_005427 [Serendipita sp. 411]|nr:hypothetical protein FRB91_005427 [Serendipita sp. 411]